MTHTHTNTNTTTVAAYALDFGLVSIVKLGCSGLHASDVIFVQLPTCVYPK